MSTRPPLSRHCLALPLAITLAFGAMPAFAQGAPDRTTILGGGAPSVTLNAALARLARDPRNVTALLDAGSAALAVGDTQAALGFFTRADQVAPGNARIKAQVGSALVMAGEPTEALRYFDAAESANGDAASFASDRALAYDLVGDNRSAQRWYQTALVRGQTDEVVRRYALSLAIGGDRAMSERVLAPLISRQDRAAWRIRTFALAIAGNEAQAVETARAMMPGQLADGITPYLRYMPRLTRAQQAAAALLGRFPRAADIGTDDSRIMQYAAAHPEIGRGLTPVGQPLGLASADDSRTSRARRRRPGEPEPRVTSRASDAIDGDLPASAAPPAQAERKGRNQRDTRLAIATPPPAPVYSPPPVRPAPAPSVRSVLDLPPGMGTIARGSSQPVTIPVRPAVPPPAINPTPPAVRPTQLATAPATQAGMLRAAPPPAATPPAATPPATRPAALAAAAPPPTTTVAATQMAVTSPPPPVAAAPAGSSFDLARLDGGRPAPAAGVSAPATGSAIAPVTLPASTAAGTVALTPSAAPSAAAPVSQPPVTPPAPAPVTSKAPAFGEAFAEFARPRGDKAATRPRGERPDAPDASRTDEEPVTVTRGSRLAMAETRAKAARAAAKTPAEPLNPSRVWVQIATAPSREGMVREWGRLARIAPAALEGQGGWVTSWGRNYRLLVGPFADEDEAQALQKELARSRVPGFVWTSQTGQAIDHVAGAKPHARQEVAEEKPADEPRTRRGRRGATKAEPVREGKAGKAAAEREDKATVQRGRGKGKAKAAEEDADEKPVARGKAGSKAGGRTTGKARAAEADDAPAVETKSRKGRSTRARAEEAETDKSGGKPAGKRGARGKDKAEEPETGKNRASARGKAARQPADDEDKPKARKGRDADEKPAAKRRRKPGD